MTLLSVAGLTVRYEDTPRLALDEVSLELAEGERLGIIGESGSGKSTLAHVLCGILPASGHVGGRIAWPGLGRTAMPGRDVGLVPQDPSSSLDPVMRVGDQIAEVVHTHLGLSWEQSRIRAVELIARVRLPDPPGMARAYPHQLSGGQRQRIAIACAIAGEPRLLVSDEATSALDNIVQAEIVQLLDELARSRRMSVMFITHDIALASQLVDSMAVFRDGTIVEAGAAADLLSRPRSPYTLSLIQAHVGLGA